MSSMFSSPSLFIKRICSFFKKKSTEPLPYSGKPRDYLDAFMESVQYIDQWPFLAKTWAKVVVKKHKLLRDGIAEITTQLVEDGGNIMKTKYFNKDEKKEIVDFLLSNKQYMQIAENSFGNLVD